MDKKIKIILSLAAGVVVIFTLAAVYYIQEWKRSGSGRSEMGLKKPETSRSVFPTVPAPAVKEPKPGNILTGKTRPAATGQVRALKRRLHIDNNDSTAVVLSKLKEFCSWCNSLEEAMYGSAEFRQIILEKLSSAPGLVTGELKEYGTVSLFYRQLLVMFSEDTKDPGLRSAIRNIASDEVDDSRVRILAIRDLGAWKAGEDIEAVRGLIKDRSDEIRREAIDALPAPLSDSDVAAVAGDLSSKDHLNQIIACRALTKSASKDAENSILNLLNSDELRSENLSLEKRVIKMNAVRSLGSFNSDDSGSFLTHIIASGEEHPDVRKAAAEALAMRPSSQNEAALIAALDNAPPDLVVIIARSLAAMNAKSAIPALQKIADVSTDGYEIEELKNAISKLRSN